MSVLFIEGQQPWVLEGSVTTMVSIESRQYSGMSYNLPNHEYYGQEFYLIQYDVQGHLFLAPAFNLDAPPFEGGGFSPYVMLLADIDGNGETMLFVLGDHRPLYVFRLVDGVPLLRVRLIP
jgi:hypothetical protein